MKDTTKFITLVIDAILLVFIAVICYLFYNLELTNSLPEYLYHLDSYSMFKIPVELLYYTLLLYLFTGRSFNLKKWGIGFLAIVISRILVSGAVAGSFYYLSKETGNSLEFNTALKDALYNFTPTYIIQFLISPWLAYPFLESFFPGLLNPDSTGTELPKRKSIIESETPDDAFITPKEIDEMVKSETIPPGYMTNKKASKGKFDIEKVKLPEKEDIGSKPLIKTRPQNENKPMPDWDSIMNEPSDAAKQDQTKQNLDLDKILNENQISSQDVNDIFVETQAPSDVIESEKEETAIDEKAPEKQNNEANFASDIPEIELEDILDNDFLIEEESNDEDIEDKTIENIQNDEQKQPIEEDKAVIADVIDEQTPKEKTSKSQTLRKGKPKNLAEDEAFVMFQEILDLNYAKKAAGVLKKILKDNVDFPIIFKASVLERIIETGENKVSAEYIYDQAPFEFIDFQKTQKDLELDSMFLKIPIEELLVQMDKDIPLDETPEPVKWMTENEKIPQDDLFKEAEVPKEKDTKIVDQYDDMELNDTNQDDQSQKEKQTEEQPAENIKRSEGVIQGRETIEESIAENEQFEQLEEEKPVEAQASDSDTESEDVKEQGLEELDIENMFSEIKPQEENPDEIQEFSDFDSLPKEQKEMLRKAGVDESIFEEESHEDNETQEEGSVEVPEEENTEITEKDILDDNTLELDIEEEPILDDESIDSEKLDESTVIGESEKTEEAIDDKEKSTDEINDKSIETSGTEVDSSEEESEEMPLLENDIFEDDFTNEENDDTLQTEMPISLEEDGKNEEKPEIILNANGFDQEPVNDDIDIVMDASSLDEKSTDDSQDDVSIEIMGDIFSEGDKATSQIDTPKEEIQEDEKNENGENIPSNESNIIEAIETDEKEASSEKAVPVIEDKTESADEKQEDEVKVAEEIQEGRIELEIPKEQKVSGLFNEELFSEEGGENNQEEEPQEEEFPEIKKEDISAQLEKMFEEGQKTYETDIELEDDFPEEKTHVGGNKMAPEIEDTNEGIAPEIEDIKDTIAPDMAEEKEEKGPKIAPEIDLENVAEIKENEYPKEDSELESKQNSIAEEMPIAIDLDEEKIAEEAEFENYIKQDTTANNKEAIIAPEIIDEPESHQAGQEVKEENQFSDRQEEKSSEFNGLFLSPEEIRKRHYSVDNEPKDYSEDYDIDLADDIDKMIQETDHQEDQQKEARTQDSEKELVFLDNDNFDDDLSEDIVPKKKTVNEMAPNGEYSRTIEIDLDELDNQYSDEPTNDFNIEMQLPNKDNLLKETNLLDELPSISKEDKTKKTEKVDSEISDDMRDLEEILNQNNQQRQTRLDKTDFSIDKPADKVESGLFIETQEDSKDVDEPELPEDVMEKLEEQVKEQLLAADIEQSMIDRYGERDFDGIDELSSSETKWHNQINTQEKLDDPDFINQFTISDDRRSSREKPIPARGEEQNDMLDLDGILQENAEDFISQENQKEDLPSQKELEEDHISDTMLESLELEDIIEDDDFRPEEKLESILEDADVESGLPGSENDRRFDTLENLDETEVNRIDDFLSPEKTKQQTQTHDDSYNIDEIKSPEMTGEKLTAKKNGFDKASIFHGKKVNKIEIPDRILAEIYKNPHIKGKYEAKKLIDMEDENKTESNIIFSNIEENIAIDISSTFPQMSLNSVFNLKNKCIGISNGEYKNKPTMLLRLDEHIKSATMLKSLDKISQDLFNSKNGKKTNKNYAYPDIEEKNIKSLDIKGIKYFLNDDEITIFTDGKLKALPDRLINKKLHENEKDLMNTIFNFSNQMARTISKILLVNDRKYLEDGVFKTDRFVGVMFSVLGATVFYIADTDFKPGRLILNGKKIIKSFR